MGKAIKIKNIGAIVEGVIPYVEGGGVVELVGPQGCGKSTTLDVIDAIAGGGKGKLPLRDHADAGLIEGLGVSIHLKSRTTRTGQPTVCGLDSNLSVADIVDPGIADHAAADAKRLEALVKLAGIKATREMFLPIFDGDASILEAVVPPESISTSDLVATAKRIKRDCEKAAREEEAGVEKIKAALARLEADWKDADLDACHDEEHLKAQYLEAVRAEADARAVIEAAQVQQASVERSRAVLAEFDATPGKSAARASAEYVVAKARNEAAFNAVQEAKARHAAAEKDMLDAERVLQSATDRENTMEALRAALEKFDSAKQLQADLPAATARAKACEDAMTRGAATRKAIAAKQQAQPLQAQLDRCSSVALQLRHAAQATDRVVSDAFAALGTPLKVENERLLINTGRGPTPFGELSDGERWKIALDIAIGCVGPNGIITIPQWAWGELQPANKKAIADRLRACNVLAYTAVATDGAGLTAREYTS